MWSQMLIRLRCRILRHRVVTGCLRRIEILIDTLVTGLFCCGVVFARGADDLRAAIHETYGRGGPRWGVAGALSRTAKARSNGKLRQVR